MSTRRSAAPSKLHVSLADEPQDSVSIILDDALEKLAEIGDGPQPEAEGVPGTRTSVITSVENRATPLPLIDAMLAAPNRTDAAVALVERIADEFPEARVRCGIGTTRLSRLVDERFGWLSPGSRPFEDTAARWDEFGSENRPRQGQPPTGDSPPSKRGSTPAPQAIRRPGRLELHLPQPDGGGRCVVWIDWAAGNDKGSVNVVALDWLTDSLATLAAVYWSRPRHAWPRILTRVAQRSRTLTTIGLVAVTLAAIWPIEYRVPCTARVDTLRQRMIATPFEASLLSAKVHPGDSVSAGDVLAVLDGRPLRLERESIEAEIQRASKEHDVALATGRIADAQQAKLKRRQFERRYEMLTDRLHRLEVVSPIDGVVISGELQRYEGATLKLGQTLMEIAPIDSMVIEIEIPEHEIGFVHPHAETRVRVAAIGGKSLRMRLDELFPAAEVRDDRNVFIGRIKVDNRQLQLKPGMRGEAVTYGPLRPWIWSWVRGNVERIIWWIGY